MPDRAIRPWWRGIAFGCFALVGLLVVLGASPGLHAALHADAAHADHACAVTLFVHGLDAPVADRLRPVAPLTWTELLPPVAVETLRPTPRYWLPPHCGPPAG